LAILRLVQLTDDTVSVQKNLFNELLTTGDEKLDSSTSPLLDIALSDSASKIFLMLLIEDDEARHKCFDPYENLLLAPNPTVEEDGKEVPTSKKDALVRNKELVKLLREPLIELCRNHAEQLLRSRPGSMVLKEVYAAWQSEQVVGSVIDVCKKTLMADRSAKADDETALFLFEDFTGHLAIKNLILADASDNVQRKVVFASDFLTAFESQLMDICNSNRGAFVVAALCEVPSVRDRTITKLDKKKLLQQQFKTEKGSTAGFKALVASIEGTSRSV
jgi:pumilio homology domain family member 6